MKKYLFLAVAFSCLGVSIRAQDAEKDTVRRVVETYLFSEETGERKQTIYEQAKIYSTDAESGKIKETRFAPEKRRKGERIASRQKIVDIEISEDAAIVKVETDLSMDNVKIPKHFQYLSLLKSNGVWKIVSILMPKIKSSQ